MDSPREFFETLETRVDPAKAAGLTATYLFEIDGAGAWRVDVDDGHVSVSENGGDADCTISASSDTEIVVSASLSPSSTLTFPFSARTIHLPAPSMSNR